MTEVVAGAPKTKCLVLPFPVHSVYAWNNFISQRRNQYDSTSHSYRCHRRGGTLQCLLFPDDSLCGHASGKNIGPAGVVIAIIREDLITDDVLPGTPTMLKWKTQADNDSLYNTPPCYNIYICGKVFKWLKKMGGLSVMKERNEEKAKILYDFLDQSRLFKGTVRKEDRSLMNVPFVTGNEELDAKFVKEAAAAGFVNLKGHRTVGGMRASIYNAMPKAGVEKLVEFMKKFEEENA